MTLHSTFQKGFKSGYVALLGAPNAGKSTLLNSILKQKITITSKKPQTTRNRILGIVHRPNAQIIFMDTPGIHRTQKLFNSRIVDVAISSISDVDILLLVIDCSDRDIDSENIIIDELKKQKKPVILGINKIDLIEKNKILSIIEDFRLKFSFESIIPLSAKRGDMIDDLLCNMESLLPEGFPYFPDESITDLSQRFIAGEIIREKAFRLTGNEIPYSVAVTVDRYNVEENSALTHIDATIHVERDSQKGIIIGKGGSKLRQIGQTARLEIQEMTQSKVMLKLFVSVQKNWSKDTKALKKFGY